MARTQVMKPKGVMPLSNGESDARDLPGRVDNRIPNLFRTPETPKPRHPSTK